MSVSESPTRATTAARKAGYVIAVLVNVGLLLAVNVWPGWDVVPVLTGDTRLVLSAVNASIAVTLVANALYAVHDPTWLKSPGDLVTLGVGALALVRIWQVFPFDLGTNPLDWALVVRLALAVGIIGSCLGMLVALAIFVRSVPKA
jgi:hypothetical protein